VGGGRPYRTKMSAVTVLTRNDRELITNVAIHHHPLDTLLEFSAEMARRTKRQNAACTSTPAQGGPGHFRPPRTLASAAVGDPRAVVR
jgi:hypothetical protein